MIRKLVTTAIIVAAFAGAFFAGQHAAYADGNPPNCPTGTNWDAVLHHCV